MADEEVNYASVTFNTKKLSRSQVKKEEETIYDDVKVKHKATEQTPDTNNVSIDERSGSRRHHYQQLACCLGTFCVILVLGIIAVTVYQRQVMNLTAENHSLREKNEQLEAQNKVLETEKENLTEQIRDISWNNLNISRSQWSIDAYCPKENNNRACKPCQNGWDHVKSSCYAVNNPERDEWKTWEEAQENCREKSSDLPVVINEEEKKTVSENSWKYDENKGYWIGLRVKDGKWKWLDGRNLTNSSWIDQPPSDGHCAVSVQNEGFKSVNCNEKNRWICKKKAVVV
ncbi:C-type lectin domain family 12 member A isoform X1 [Haplochromis burtoni]|uniref:C-type lectin domain family 12 member A-like n=1 Tax=Haplochromis burtoni TaxID=8153 RepID=A0A3Q2VI60_HAPBU|nr:C-type lectin domain family 12 member A isoform X1 [Haplochromis burtoni]